VARKREVATAWEERRERFKDPSTRPKTADSGPEPQFGEFKFEGYGQIQVDFTRLLGRADRWLDCANLDRARLDRTESVYAMHSKDQGRGNCGAIGACLWVEENSNENILQES
jgi:hypothetical protein